MRDEMSAYSGVAASYRSMPLSALRQLESILNVEIEERLRSFGVIKVGEAVESVGDVEKANVAGVGRNLQEKSHPVVKLTVLQGGLK